MKFIIHHERPTFIFMTFGIMVALLCTNKLFGIGFSSPLLIAESVLLVLMVFLTFLDKVIGTTIIINENDFSIQQLFGNRRISYGEVLSINIENYTRHRANRPDVTYRMRMIISTATGKEIELNDNASKIEGVSGIVVGIHTQTPNEEVGLYQAYMMIKSKVKGPIVSSY